VCDRLRAKYDGDGDGDDDDVDNHYYMMMMIVMVMKKMMMMMIFVLLLQVSRMGMIFLSDEDVNVRRLVTKWLNHQPEVRTPDGQ
jgi:type IV secretory pathway VirB3-like protein